MFISILINPSTAKTTGLKFGRVNLDILCGCTKKIFLKISLLKGGFGGVNSQEQLLNVKGANVRSCLFFQ